MKLASSAKLLARVKSSFLRVFVTYFLRSICQAGRQILHESEWIVEKEKEPEKKGQFENRDENANCRDARTRSKYYGHRI